MVLGWESQGPGARQAWAPVSRVAADPHFRFSETPFSHQHSGNIPLKPLGHSLPRGRLSLDRSCRHCSCCHHPWKDQGKEAHGNKPPSRALSPSWEPLSCWAGGEGEGARAKVSIVRKQLLKSVWAVASVRGKVCSLENTARRSPPWLPSGSASVYIQG